MSSDPQRRIERRRAIIATLRSAAERSERLAREYRESADRLERSTDELERPDR